MGNEKNNIEYETENKECETEKQERETENKELCGWITEDFYANFSRGEYLYFDKETKEIEKKELGGSKKEIIFKYLFEHHGMYCDKMRLIDVLAYAIDLEDFYISEASLLNILYQLRQTIKVNAKEKILTKSHLGIRLNVFETDCNEVRNLYEKKIKEGYHYPN